MRRAQDTGTLLAPVAVAAVAVVCCAGLPVLAGVFGALTLAAILGIGGVLIGLLAVVGVAVLILRGRRRRSCAPNTERLTS
jgi:hypothetical protein